jgi:hypothetical protein
MSSAALLESGRWIASNRSEPPQLEDIDVDGDVDMVMVATELIKTQDKNERPITQGLARADQPMARV